MGGILFTCPGFKQAVLERVDTLGFIPKETGPLVPRDEGEQTSLLASDKCSFHILPFLTAHQLVISDYAQPI